MDRIDAGSVGAEEQPLEVPLSDAAMLTSLPYLRARDMMFRGLLVGRRTEGGRWMVTLSSCRALAQHLKQGAVPA